MDDDDIQEVAEAALRLYQTYNRRHYFFEKLGPPDEFGKRKNSLTKPVDAAPTLNDWVKHLTGKPKLHWLGVCPVVDDDGSHSMFAGGDIDVPMGHFDLIGFMQDVRRHCGDKVLFHRSKSSGLRYKLFAAEVSDVALLHDAIRGIASRARVMERITDALRDIWKFRTDPFPSPADIEKKLEVFPNRGPVGATLAKCLFMPYAGGVDADSNGIALDDKGKHIIEMDAGRWFRLAERSRLTPGELEELASHAHAPPPVQVLRAVEPGVRTALRVRRAERLLSGAVKKLRDRKTSLHNAIGEHCFVPGRLVGAGLLEREYVRDQLMEVIGKWPPDPSDPNKATKFLDETLDAGARQPWVDDWGGRTELEVDETDLTRAAGDLDSLFAAAEVFIHAERPSVVMPSETGIKVVPMSVEMVVNKAHTLCQPVDIKGGLTLPDRVARLYLGRAGDWVSPQLNGVTSAPLLMPDGSIHIHDGYDPATRMWCEGADGVAVPEMPTREQAQAALLEMRTLVRTFPFADAVMVEDELPVEVGEPITAMVVDPSVPPQNDESAALHAMLTAVCRPSLWTAPGFVVNGPVGSGSGVGKGLLVRALITVATGKVPGVMTKGHNTEELDKRIVSEAFEGRQVIFLDNINATLLRSDTLASMMTERPYNIRPLGSTRSIEVNNPVFIAMTGNGLAVSEDLARRFLSADLDARMEDPEQRPFPPGFLGQVAATRDRLLSACLTVWRWGRQGRLPRGRALGSYEVWCSWVRDPLLALGCCDPVDKVDLVKAQDPRRLFYVQLFRAWWEKYGAERVAAAGLHQDLVEMLDPENGSRQRVAVRLKGMVNMRTYGLVLNCEQHGKWNPAKYWMAPTDEANPPPNKGPRATSSQGHLYQSPIE